MITRDELLEALRALNRWDISDYEYSHGEADALLILYINDEEIQDAYDDIGKWYA